MQIDDIKVMNYMLNPTDSPTYVLLVTDHDIVLYNLKSASKIIIEGHKAIFVGNLSEIAELIVGLKEDKTTVFIYEITSQALKVFNLTIKIKSLFWTPNKYGITYATLHEHSIRLSKGFTSKEITDISLDLCYRLEYDEYLVTAQWNINGKILAVATSKRICILDPSLLPIQNYYLLQIPMSIYWFGSTLIYSNTEGIFYCGDSIKLIMHTFSKSIICALLCDRIYLYTENLIKAFPCNNLEPLLWGCLENNISKVQIEKITRLMITPCVSEDIIKKLLAKGFVQAAWQLAEKSVISTQLKIEILKNMNMFEEIERTLLRGKDISDPIEYYHFLEEFHSDHNWKLEKTLFPEISDFLDSRGQLQRESKFLKISKNYWKLSLLHLSVGNPYPLTDLPFTPEPSLEDSNISPTPSLVPLNLGYGELAYKQLVNSQEILIAYSENLSQCFGWESLKPPEKYVPQYMDQNIKIKEVQIQNLNNPQDEEEVKNESENEADTIALYLRCDEGKGENICDVINSKITKINENQWAGILDEGEPLEYDDKWGKQARPSYKISVDKENLLTIDEIKLQKSWTFEFWILINEENSNICTIGSLIFQIDSKRLRIFNSSNEMQIKECEDLKEIELSTWEHFCIAAKMPEITIYIGGKLSYLCNIKKIESNNTIIVGGFCGYITELRLWKSCRKIEEIKENYKCPLEILSEKRKKIWSNIKINKNENSLGGASLSAFCPISSPTASKTGFRLAMPEGKPRIELKPPRK